MRALALIVVGFLVVQSGPALAKPAPEDKADLARVEAYLNEIRTLRAKFIQIAPDGSLSGGRFLMQRPGRLRFQYDPPVPILVVTNGDSVVFIDYEAKQVTRLSLDSTPISVLVAKRIKLGGKVSVDQVRRGPGTLSVTLSDPKSPEQGAITLVFSDDPLVLRKWLVRDATGQETAIALSEIEVNVDLGPKAFAYSEPLPDENMSR